jgi:hypothetical protein
VCSRQIPPRPPLPLRLFCVHLINVLGNLLILILNLWKFYLSTFKDHFKSLQKSNMKSIIKICILYI